MTVARPPRHAGTYSPDWTGIMLAVILGVVTVTMLVTDRLAVEITGVVPMVAIMLGKLRQPRHRATDRHHRRSRGR